MSTRLEPLVGSNTERARHFRAKNATRKATARKARPTRTAHPAEEQPLALTARRRLNSAVPTWESTPPDRMPALGAHQVEVPPETVNA